MTEWLDDQMEPAVTNKVKTAKAHMLCAQIDYAPLPDEEPEEESEEEEQKLPSQPAKPGSKAQPPHHSPTPSSPPDKSNK
eukprot:scaffold41669_cov16-Tisochrysis_lutea.AAC.1